MSPEITVVSSVEDWFDAALTEVVRSEHVSVDSLTQQYVVSVLSEAERTQREIEFSNRPLPLLLAEAESKVPAERFELFRRIGDHVLLTQGFFRARTARGPSPEYFVNIGRDAYRRASRVLHTGRDELTGDPLRSLSRRFDEWIELLHRLYEYVLAHSKNEARDLVHLLGLWNEERSPGIERVLRGRGVSLSGARLLPS